MPYSTPQDVRDLLGIEIDDAPDALLNKYITKAQKIVMKHIQIPIVNEDMGGSINGINSTFTTENGFWANTTGTLGIGTMDFTVYIWPDEEDEFTKINVTGSISAYDPVTGRLKLNFIPSLNDYDKVTIDYSYYTCKIDWDLVSLATSYYAAMMYIGREFYLVPERVFLGEMRLQRTKGEPWETLRKEFRRIIDLLVAAPMDVVAYEKMVLDPRSTKSASSEEGTWLQIMDLN